MMKLCVPLVGILLLACDQGPDTRALAQKSEAPVCKVTLEVASPKAHKGLAAEREAEVCAFVANPEIARVRGFAPESACGSTEIGGLRVVDRELVPYEAGLEEFLRCNAAISRNPPIALPKQDTAFVWELPEPTGVETVRPGDAPWENSVVTDLMLMSGVPIVYKDTAGPIICFEVAEGASDPLTLLTEVGYQAPPSLVQKAYPGETCPAAADRRYGISIQR